MTTFNTTLVFILTQKQCSGSRSASESGSIGFVCLWASWIRTLNFFYGSGSGSVSFHQQTKNLRKNSTVLWLLHDSLSLKNDVNVTSKRNKHKIIFCCHLEGHDKIARSVSPSTDPRIRIRVRIRTKMSRIPNTMLRNGQQLWAAEAASNFFLCFSSLLIKPLRRSYF